MRRCGCNSLRNAADKEQKGDFAQPYCLLSITTAARVSSAARVLEFSLLPSLAPPVPLPGEPSPPRPPARVTFPREFSPRDARPSGSPPLPRRRGWLGTLLGALRRKRAEKRNAGATISPIGYFCSLLSNRAAPIRENLFEFSDEFRASIDDEGAVPATVKRAQ